MCKAIPAVLLLATVVPLTGCNTKTKATPANYIETMNAYFVEHPECLLSGGTRFPYEVGEKDPQGPSQQQMDALAASKLVEAKREPAIHISRYTLTAEGTRLAPRFCFGHRVVTSLDSSTPPAPANGFTETQVAYHYRVSDVPVWAKSAEIAAAFPIFQHETSGQATDKMTLALTGVGWSVPD
jgi:hypothetical protein